MDNDEAVLLLVLSGHGSTSKISRMFRKQKKKQEYASKKKDSTELSGHVR